MGPTADPRANRRLRCPAKAWAAVGLAMTAHSVALAQSSKVSITGGADASGKNYSWVVTNEHSSPIVSVDFPHFRGSLFLAPNGWDTACTSLVNVGVPDVPGSCEASVKGANRGIRPRQEESFRLRMDAKGARRGLGAVRIRFADETEVSVSGVEVPQQENRAEKFMPIVGLVPMLIVIILVRRKRNRSITSQSAAN